MTVRIHALLLVLLLASTLMPCHGETAADPTAWDGPSSGPRKQLAKKVTFISQDFKNGGISRVFRSFYTACKELGWRINLVDGRSDPKIIRTAFQNAIQTHQDAIVLGGFQTDDNLSDLPPIAKDAGIVLVGWHAAAEPGSTHDLFMNVATTSSEVAKMAADYVIQHSNGKAGVIIFNDPHFAVANAKTKKMKEELEQCRKCRVLTVENLPIANAGDAVPAAVPRLAHTYGKAWTHTLAINDVYFDAMNIPLLKAGRPDIENISAGDGSNTALERIRSGHSQQAATVAEPAGIQGWQLADELNRAFSGAPPSGYVAKPILVTTTLLQQVGSSGIDSNIPYRAAYEAIWNKGTTGP